MPNRPLLSIVIPNLDDHAQLAKTISSIEQQSTLESDQLEIIIVDASSEPWVANSEAKFRITVLSSPPGRASQLNLGQEHANAACTLFLHADTLLPQSFDQLIIDTLEDSSVVVGAFRLAIANANLRLSLVAWGANLRSKFCSLPYGDQAFFVRRNHFEDLNGFRELRIMEDFDFVRRARRRGKIITKRESVLTSDRRWRQKGIGRTTIINQIVVAGYYLGLSDKRLASIYGKLAKRTKGNS